MQKNVILKHKSLKKIGKSTDPGQNSERDVEVLVSRVTLEGSENWRECSLP